MQLSQRADEIVGLIRTAAGVVDDKGHTHAPKGLGELSGRFVKVLQSGDGKGKGADAEKAPPLPKAKPVGVAGLPEGADYPDPAKRQRPRHTSSNEDVKTLIDQVIKPSGIDKTHWTVHEFEGEDWAVVVGPRPDGGAALAVSRDEDGWTREEWETDKKGDIDMWSSGEQHYGDPLTDRQMITAVKGYLADKPMPS